MSSFESRLAEIFDGQSRPLDPGVTDPDFDACIMARAEMTDPCGWMQKGYCEIRTYFGYRYGQTFHRPIACWGGRILMALGIPSYALAQDKGYHIPREVFGHLTRISNKLGFEINDQLYTFNDNSSHGEVIAEFDRRLQAWGDR